MPVRLRCPGCQTAYQLPDTVRGKTVRCKSCSKSFKIPSGPAVAVGAAGSGDPRRAQVGSAAAPRKLAKDQAIKEVSKKTKPLPPDDDDDEPVTPRPKRKVDRRAKERKRSPMLLIAILVGAIVLVSGVAVGAVIMFSGDSAKTAQTQGKKSGTQPNQQDTDQKKSPQKQNTPAQDPKDELVNGEPLAAEAAISYTAHIKPFLATYCGKCHGDEVQKGNTHLQSYETIIKGGRKNRPLVTKGEPDKSSIVMRVEQKMKGMPPRGEKQPTAAEKTLLRRWIQAGAVDDSGNAGGLFDDFDLRAHVDIHRFQHEPALTSHPFHEMLHSARWHRVPLSSKLK